MAYMIASIADQDGMPHFVASHQGLHCLLMSSSGMLGIKELICMFFAKTFFSLKRWRTIIPNWVGSDCEHTGFYYIPITDTTLELSVFWPSDTESRINELRFSESISLSFKTRLTSVTCFCGDVTKSKLQPWNQRRNTFCRDVKKCNVMANVPAIFRDLRPKPVLKSERMSEKGHIINILS